MGSWGYKPFENDDSMDWSYELEKSNSLSVLSRALSLNLLDYLFLRAPKASIILAACEVLAAGLGKTSNELPKEIEKWVASNKGLNFSKLIQKAKSSVRRVTGSRSELRMLWSSNDENYKSWLESVKSLENKLCS